MGGQAMDAKRLSGGFLVDPNRLTIIGRDTDDGPEHPLWDKRAKLAPDEQLADAMLRDGFQGVIEVRKNGTDKNGEDIFEVIFGRRRTLAGRRAGEKSKQPFLVNVLVRKYTDEEAFAVRVGENIRRKDLSALDKADELQRYMKRGHNEAEAATVFDMTVNGVKNLLRIFDCNADIRKAVENHELSFAAAAELADLPREEQTAAMNKMLEEQKNTGTKATKKAARKAKAARNNSEKTVAPPKRLVTNLLKLDKRHGGIINEDTRKGILWALGEVQSSSIKGLRDLEKELEDMKAKKASKKKTKAAAK